MVICDSSSLIHFSTIGRLGLLYELHAELDRLRTDGGFWIEEGLFKTVLQSVGEE